MFLRPHRSLLTVVLVAVGCAVTVTAQRSTSISAATFQKRLPPSCPPAGTVIPLTKATSPSFVNDYKDCDIVVEAIFFKMGNEGSALGKYDTKANTTFQVLEPGGTAQSRRGRDVGMFAGTPKVNSDVLFELKQGDTILLRGHPIGISAIGKVVLTIFHAESVTRK